MRLVHYRFRVARRALAAWAIAVALATVTAVVVTATLTAAARARDRWLPTSPVVIARRLIKPGETLDEANTMSSPVPGNQHGLDLLQTLPTGRVAAATIYAGEAVRASRIVGAGVASPGARLVAVPANERTPPLTIGDRVDVLGAATQGRDASAGMSVVAAAATVVSVNDQRVVVAIKADELAPVASAIADGSATLAIER